MLGFLLAQNVSEMQTGLMIIEEDENLTIFKFKFCLGNLFSHLKISKLRIASARPLQTAVTLKSDDLGIQSR